MTIITMNRSLLNILKCVIIIWYWYVLYVHSLLP